MTVVLADPTTICVMAWYLCKGNFPIKSVELKSVNCDYDYKCYMQTFVEVIYVKLYISYFVFRDQAKD